MKRINAGFYILLFFALAAGLVLLAIPNKAYAFINSQSISCMGGIISSSPFSGILIWATAGILGIGLLSALIQIFKTKFYLNNLLTRKIIPSKRLVKILNKLSLGDKTVIVKNKDIFSFCAGLFSPYIVLSTALIKSLTDKELEAVLLHEQSHLLARDPLKVLAGRTFAAMFFFLPIFRELYKYTEGTSEYLADQWTINSQKKSAFLKNAMKKIISSDHQALSFVSNATSADYFEIRIRRLSNPKIKSKLKVSFFSLATTILFLGAGIFFFSMPVKAEHMETSTQKEQENCHKSDENPGVYIPVKMHMPEKRCD